MDYYNRVNIDLLNAVPTDAKLVVEVGCGAGALGEEYRKSNPGVRYVGIEMFAAAAAKAKERLNHVAVGNAETISAAEAGVEEGTVDCLVYGDVLEHLVDPWSLLKRHAAWLRGGCMVAACIPNAQHWSLVLRLLLGDWRYQDEGLLDRTHLRFFTLPTIRELFAGAGLEIEEVRSRQAVNPNFPRYLELMAPVLKVIGADPNQFALHSATLQYVVKARKPASP